MLHRHGKRCLCTLDSIRWDGLVGTIAGDDTILLVMKDTESAQGITEELNKLAQ